MKKLLTVSILCSVILFTGCCDKEHIPVPPKYPEIRTLPIVGSVDVNVSEGCLCGDDVGKVFGLVRQLRKSEAYYQAEITRYNVEFKTGDQNGTR